MKTILGVKSFRLNLVLSLLKNEKILIKDIRVSNSDPGLKGTTNSLYLAHEIKFLEILSELSQGTAVEISDTGIHIKLTNIRN